jgi:hypothetical protein
VTAHSLTVEVILQRGDDIREAVMTLYGGPHDIEVEGFSCRALMTHDDLFRFLANQQEVHVLIGTQLWEVVLNS